MNEEMITWSDDDFNSKSEAMSKFNDNIESYTGLPKSQGNHYRHFIDIEPNRSVKPDLDQAITTHSDLTSRPT